MRMLRRVKDCFVCPQNAQGRTRLLTLGLSSLLNMKGAVRKAF
jgi:hypothetical protein